MDSDINSIFKKLGGGYIAYLDFEQKLSRDLFEKIVKRFIYSEANGGLGNKYMMKSELKINVPDSDFFIEIEGKNEVKRYWQFMELPLNCYKMERVISFFQVKKYGFGIKLIDKIEKEIDKGIERALSSDISKEYIYNNIYEIDDEKYHFKTYLIEEKRILSKKKFKESGCLTATPSYYVKIVIDENLNSEDFYNYLSIYVRWLIEELQQTNFIVTVDEKISLLDSLKRLIKHSELRSNNFLLAEPVEILRRNFHRNDRFPFVKEDYALSYLPDGELRFLYISENFSKNVDGKIFMINQNFDVINTGRMIDNFENTLVEGYYSEKNNLFYITDILFYKGNDVRNSAFFAKNAGAKDKYRYDYLSQFYREGIQKSDYINSELKDEATRFIVARYLFGNGPIFEDNLNELFNLVEQQDFVVKGVQFRPINDRYPEKGGHWYSLFKWNYPQFQTAEFLVKYMMDGKNQRLNPFQLPSKGKDLPGKIIYYKTLELKVGGYKDIPNNGEINKILTAIDFAPRGVDHKLDVNLANIPLDDAGKVVAHSELSGVYEEIQDNSIVEFAFVKRYGDVTNLFKWTPIRVNHRKTELYRNGESVFGMTESYSNHVWNSLTNIITENNLREGTVPEEDISETYYANNTMRLKKFPFQIFHNRVVKDNLIKNICPAIINKSKTMMGSLLDLACGSGGDFSKWVLGKLKTVVGIDFSRDNIETAINLYKKARRPKPDVSYIWGNSSKLIFPDFDAGMDYQAKELMKKIFLSKNQYDVVSVQFAIHYMFEDEITLRTLLQNVSDNLKIGGYFVGTSLDGQRVYDLLAGKEKEIGLVGNDLLWSIKKEYDLKKWDSKKSNLGHKIGVFVSTIGIEHKEYLVNYDYLKELAKEYGLEIVSIKSFGEIYDEALDYKTEWDADLRNMSPGEKIFSFLHNEFTFVKRRDASDKTYKQLMSLISKKAKKNERLSQFNNERIKIKVRSGGKQIRKKIVDEESTDLDERTDSEYSDNKSD